MPDKQKSTSGGMLSAGERNARRYCSSERFEETVKRLAF
jgi:hypothetical protein